MNRKPFYNKYPVRHCEVCKGSDSKLLFRQQFSAVADGNLLTGYDVVVCQHCGFCFADRIPSQKSFDKYYRDMSKYEYQDTGGKESEFDLLRFRSIAEFIMPFLPDTKARLLDVGCATGRLLSILKEGGYTNVTGIDPSPECSAIAKRMFDITVLNIPLTASENLGQKYECIFLSGVLEHLKDLEPALIKLRSILADGGMIFVEVPNACDFRFWQDAPFQEFSTEHINFFSTASLQNLMSSYDFTTVVSTTTTRKQTASTTMPVISALFRQTHLRLQHIPLPDKTTETDLIEYISKSKEIEKRIQHAIDMLVADQTPLAIWGVGTHTLRLLATSRLLRANIQIFIDTNPHYQGKEIRGIPIISPSDLPGRTEAILISTRGHQNAIKSIIEKTLNMNNQIITLYELDMH